MSSRTVQPAVSNRFEHQHRSAAETSIPLISSAAALREPSVDPLQQLFDVALVLLGTASLDGYFTKLNPCWEQTLGWTAEELMAEPFLYFVHPDDVGSTTAAAATLAGPERADLANFENRYRARDGVYHWIRWFVSATGGSLYFVARDVSEQRATEAKRAEEASVTKVIVESIADGLYVTDSQDLLSFVNPAAVELLGYDSAEELLGRSPHELFHHLHLDGSLYPQSECPLSKVRRTGEAYHSEEDGFWRRDGSALPVSYSSAAVDLSDGTGSVVAFRDISERQTQELLVRRELEALSWVGRIRDALDQDRLVLYAQPIVEVASGETVEHELLVRMISPEGAVIAPDKFLPVAEQHDLIRDIDQRVCERAMRFAAKGHAVAINLSADSISEPGLFRFVEDQLSAHSVDPRLIVFEITETALIRNEGVAQVFIENARRLNCGVALDDFGTGYGSFRYLKQLPVTHLKIDQEFVRDLETEPSGVNHHVIQAIVTLARGMGKKTVAEGVESSTTLAVLQGLGVDYAQGYLFARPAPAEELLSNTIKGPTNDR